MIENVRLKAVIIYTTEASKRTTDGGARMECGGVWCAGVFIEC
jgi:hypothetical protein